MLASYLVMLLLLPLKTYLAMRRLRLAVAEINEGFRFRSVEFKIERRGCKDIYAVLLGPVLFGQVVSEEEALEAQVEERARGDQKLGCTSAKCVLTYEGQVRRDARGSLRTCHRFGPLSLEPHTVVCVSNGYHKCFG